MAAIGLKANVSEAEHPLLCEGTRRQRGDLALLLLVHYKDQPAKLAQIMEKLLDKDIHQLFKAPIQTSYYAQQPQRSIQAAFRDMNLNQQGQQYHGNPGPSNPGNPGHANAAGQNDRWVDWEAYLSPMRNQANPANSANSARSGGAVNTNRSSGTGPGSDSGSSGNSSADSIDSSASSKNARNYPHEYSSPDLAALGASASSSSQGAASGVASNNVAANNVPVSSANSQNGHAVYPQGAAALPPSGTRGLQIL